MIDVYGLDLSLAATGVCLPDGRVGKITTPPHERGGVYTLETRCMDIRDRIIDRINRTSGLRVLCVIEDVPMARGQLLAQLGFMQGVVRIGLLAEGIDFAMVTASQLKMFATGKGVGPKPNMRVALVQRMGIDIVDDNQCDAWWLRAMGKQALGVPLLELPLANLRALAKVQWPDITDDEDERATLAALPPQEESAPHG